MESVTIWSRFKNAWNAFSNRDPTGLWTKDVGPGNYYRPDRVRLTRGNERTIMTSVLNRIAIDAAAVMIQHCKLDDNGRYVETVDSKLNECLTLRANIDQTARAFMQDVYMSLMDEGSIAIVPVDTDKDPEKGKFDILSMRVGKIIEWFPAHVKLQVYNEKTNEKQEIIMPKTSVCVIENPWFSVMNAPSSTLKRLVEKLALLDAIDNQIGSGKLDLIIQLPYVIKSDARRQQAEDRRKDIETQLSGSKYGIAYTDGTERITQLNRPVENQLMAQIQYLTEQFYSQLSITQGVMDGTADEATMLNYHNRTIEPLVSAVVDAMKCNFLTEDARKKNKESILFFRDPFRLAPISNIAEIADKFTRNEIMTSNEVRQIVGMKPSDDPKADELVNSNISQPDSGPAQEQNPSKVKEEIQNGAEP